MPGRIKRAERERMLKALTPMGVVKSPRRPPEIPDEAAMTVLATCPMCGLRARVFGDEDRPDLPNLRYPFYEVQVFRQWFGGVKGAKGAESRGFIIHEKTAEARIPLMKALLINAEYVGRVLIDSLREEGVDIPPEIDEAAKQLEESVKQLGNVTEVWSEIETLTRK